MFNFLSLLSFLLAFCFWVTGQEWEYFAFLAVINGVWANG